MDERTESPKGVGESDSRRGEDEAKKAKEAGRREGAPDGPTDRPTGTSTARDVTGIGPQDPINRSDDQSS